MAKYHHYWFYNVRRIIENALGGNGNGETEPMTALEKNAVSCALYALAEQYKDDPVERKLRLQLIDIVYRKKSHNIPGAAMILNISERQAIRYHVQFVRYVAKNLGYLT